MPSLLSPTHSCIVFQRPLNMGQWGKCAILTLASEILEEIQMRLKGGQGIFQSHQLL